MTAPPQQPKPGPAAPSRRVTVGMPVHNGAKCLRRALQALRAQEFVEFNLVISDNASTDGTEDICREYALRDDRIQYIRQPTNIGVTANFAAVLREAQTPYFMWAAHDDLWEPTFISALVAELEHDSAIALACCNYDVYLQGPDRIVEHHPTSELPDIAGDKRKALVLRQLLRFPHPAFVYGLYRTNALRRTRVIQDMGFDWSDLALVNELALYAKLSLVPDILFHTGIAGTSREAYSVADRRFHFSRLTYGTYFRRTLEAIARAQGITVRERAVLSAELIRQVLRFIHLHEWPLPRLGRNRAPILSHRPTRFAVGEGGIHALGPGWGEPESWGTWTVDDEAVLRLTAPRRLTKNELRLQLDCRIITLPDGSPRTVDCLIGETLLERWRFGANDHRGTVHVAVPLPLMQGAHFELTFRTHEPRSPLELGMSDDTRRLGLGVECIRLA